MKLYTLEQLSDILKHHNPKKYQKVGQVKARLATEPELIVTILDGVVETTNEAKVGDYIVTGARGEHYVVDPETFNSRYIQVEVGIWESLGCCIAIEWLWDDAAFVASWGQKMIINTGDMLAATTDAKDRPYRIERKVFDQTYVLL